ncbi:MAG TPA: WhiB family transcriptional regulator [Iamia sp.]
MDDLARSDRPAMATAWADDAACKGRLDLFYAPHAERPPARARREAEGRRVCSGCPVQEPCRAHARSQLELGLWGGENEEERTEAGFPPAAAPTPSVRRSHPLAS